MRRCFPGGCGGFLVALVGVSPLPVLANGFRLVSQDAFAAARGEAFVATADNPSAIHYNPAGLTQLEGHHVRGGINALYFDPTFSPASGAANSGGSYHIEDKEAVAPQFYYAYGVPNSSVTVGLGVYAPHGASVTWPQDTGFRSVGIKGELTYLRVNPVLAVEVVPGLSVAGGFMIDYGDITLTQGLLRTERPFDNEFRFEGDDLGVGFNLGLLWQVDENWSIGATMRSATTLKFDGHTEFEQQPFIASTKLPARAEFEFPLTAVFGVSYRPNNRWNFEVNADYTNWSSIDTVTIQQKGRTPFPVQQEVPVVLEWKDSWMFKFGATHYFGDGWHASAGYLFNQNSVPDDYYTPLAVDLDRHFLTFGVGREWKNYFFDVTYQFGYGPDHKVRDSVPPSQPGRFVGQNGDGTYDWISHAVLVSAGMRF